MAISYYPSPEGVTDKNGNEYPIIFGVHPALRKWIDLMCAKCIVVIHSTNDSGHTKCQYHINYGFNGKPCQDGRCSMHYRGLAADFDIKDSNGEWKDFKSQGECAAAVADSMGIDAWIWANDEGTHSHISLHPLVQIC